MSVEAEPVVSSRSSPIVEQRRAAGKGKGSTHRRRAAVGADLVARPAEELRDLPLGAGLRGGHRARSALEAGR
jgi:hypothetical protein